MPDALAQSTALNRDKFSYLHIVFNIILKKSTLKCFLIHVYNRIGMTLQEHIRTYRVRYAIKATLASIICVIISVIWHMDYGFFSVITAYILISMYHDNTILRGLERFIGILIGSLIALLIVNLFTDSKVVYLIGMSAWIFICMYLYSDSRFPFPYAALMSGIFSGLVMLKGTEIYDEVHQFAFSLIKQIAIGVIVATLIDRFIWSLRSDRHLRDALAAVLTDFGSLFKESEIKIADSTSERDSTVQVSLDTFDHLLNLIALTSKEEKENVFPEDQYTRLVGHLRNLFIKNQILEINLEKCRQIVLNEVDIHRYITELLDLLSKTFLDFGAAIITQSKFEALSEKYSTKIKLLDCKYAALRGSEYSQEEWSQTEFLACGTFVSTIKDISIDIKNVITTYNDINSGRIFDKITTSSAVKVRKEKQIFHFNKDNIKHSFKVIIITFLVLIASLYLGLAAGVQALITALIIAAQSNLGQATLKERLRFAAVVIAGLYGLVSLVIISLSPHFPVFLALIMLGLFIGSYITTGTQRVSYAGLQTGIVLPLVMLTSNGPPLTLSIAAERFVGVIVGGGIALLVLRLIWPVDPLDQLKEKLSTALQLCGSIYSAMLISEDKKEEEVTRMIVSLASDLPTVSSLLSDARYAIRFEKMRGEELLDIIESLENIYIEFETLNKSVYGERRSRLFNAFLSYMKPCNERVVTVFSGTAEHLKYSKTIAPEIDLESLMLQIDDRRNKFFKSGISQEYDSEEFERFTVVPASIHSIISSLSQILNATQAMKEKTITLAPAESA